MFCFKTLIASVRVISIIGMCSAVTMFSVSLASINSYSIKKANDFLWIDFIDVFDTAEDPNASQSYYCLLGITIFTIFYAFGSVLLLYSTVSINRTWTYPWLVMQTISTLFFLLCYIYQVKHETSEKAHFTYIYGGITTVGAFLFWLIVFITQLTWPKEPLSGEYLKSLSSDEYIITFPPDPYGSTLKI